MIRLFTRGSAFMTTTVVVGGDAGMRDYLITIATATLAAMLLQFGSPPACAVALEPAERTHGQ